MAGNEHAQMRPTYCRALREQGRALTALSRDLRAQSQQLLGEARRHLVTIGGPQARRSR